MCSVDFDQNCRDRSIASAYSLRPLPGAPVSTPITRGPPSTTPPGSIEPLLALHEESGLGEMPYPPDHPKMPGESPRVQPSRKVAAHWDE